MSPVDTSLPAGFEALEHYVATWGVEGANNRSLARLNSTEAERVAFFNAARPLVEPALALLDAKPLDQHDAREQRLMRLLLGFAHAALAVEMQGDAEPKHAAGARFMRFTRAPADGNARELTQRAATA